MRYVATLNDHRGEGSSLSSAVVDLLSHIAEAGSDEEFDHIAKSLLALAEVSEKMVAGVSPILRDLDAAIKLRDFAEKLPPADA